MLPSPVRPLFRPVLRPLRRLRRKLASLARREQGIALVEFSLVAPVMITMYLGMVELSVAVGHERKSAQIARALSDLTTQNAMVTTSQLDAIFGAASAILAPYPLKDVSLRIASFRIDQANKVWVDWSATKEISSSNPYPTLARCTDGASFLPTQLRNKGQTVIVAWTKIKHTPMMTTFIGTINMEESVPMVPRVSTAVLREGVATTACPGETV